MRHSSRTRGRPVGSLTAAWSCVDGVKGVEVQTEKVWNYANEFMLPRMMVVTKLDKEHADIGIALDSAHNVFKRAIVPFTLPIGKREQFQAASSISST